MIERDYWNTRYRDGGNSGWCSIGDLQKWRWTIIDKHIDVSKKSVLDVGCGDLRFWGDREPRYYFGVDISEVIIEKNRVLKPDWSFFCEDVAETSLEFYCDVVLCLEMLFHVMTEERYIKILETLNDWTYEYLFISCWSERPKPFVHPHYQAHYQLEEYLPLPDLEMIKRYTTKTGLRAMYVFKRVNNATKNE